MIFSFFKQSLIHSYLYYLFCKWPKAEGGSIGEAGTVLSFTRGLMTHVMNAVQITCARAQLMLYTLRAVKTSFIIIIPRAP